jgi:tripartite-type tricarboxylate transporter receptor subunit TctC
MSRATRRLAAAALLSLATVPAMAQAPWPNQPIRLIVPFSAGVSDTIARLVSTEMSKSIGQPIVVENRAGAGGNIGS